MPLSLPDPQLPGNPKDALQSIQRNFEALALADQGLTIRGGSKTLSFSSASTAATTIDHGLGKIPSAVIALADRNEGAGILWNVTVGDFDDEDFTAQVSTIDGSSSTSAKVYWIAVAI